MWQQIFLGFIGLCSGVIIAGGVAGLMIGLAIIPRYAGISRTAEHILLYEDCTLLGTIFGATCILFKYPLPFGHFFLGLMGTFSGIFLGAWILALAEMADMFAIFCRRVKFSHGLPKVIFCIALGKFLGSLIYYYLGWQ